MYVVDNGKTLLYNHHMELFEKDDGIMDRKYFVYKHTNKLNGKVYIGITGQITVEERWKNGLGYNRYNRNGQNSHFYNAIKKIRLG